ncbi:MAG: DUF2274 domain-containing protein [Devosiaceae bacterium]|nr:DUF2274 domain-containing protein [Devosiaceae bacterium]
MPLKLSKLPKRTPIKLTSTFPPDVHSKLSDYAKIYEQNYGEKERIQDLVPFMVASFLNGDSGFKKARRELAQSVRKLNQPIAINTLKGDE